jgi:hypothetical protein
MEQQIINNHEAILTDEVINLSSLKPGSDKCFIEANTIQSCLEEIKNDHIIPVFIKDNNTLISHSDFVETTMEMVQKYYDGETILSPNIRVSHPIKGRVPSAKNKPANELFEHEKTLYYERMAFIIEIPSVFDEIDGNRLSLMVGGVKSFNLDNLYGKKGADEHFKIFIGFKNTVCTNLCVWTDGFKSDVKVNSTGQLKGVIESMIEQYNFSYHLYNLRSLTDYSLTEQQFATLIGKLRMYPYLSKRMQEMTQPLYLGDTQISTVVKDYFKDNSFCKNDDGNISLWRLYNLLTGANKSSYIDNFIDRSVNTFHFTESLKYVLMNKAESWFLN